MLKLHGSIGYGRFTTIANTGLNFQGPPNSQTATGTQGQPTTANKDINPFQGKGTVIGGNKPLPGPKNTVEAFNAIASEHEASQRREQVLQAALKRDAEKKKAQEEAKKAKEEKNNQNIADAENLEQEFEFEEHQSPNIIKNESAQNFNNIKDEEDAKRDNKEDDEKKVKKMSNDD